jgi:hypothetical protein
MLAGNFAVCAGWAATPEARMACCVEGESCPMHDGESQDSSSPRVITQAQADNCCALSEPDHSSQPNPTLVATISNAVLGNGVVLPDPTPALMLSDGWRATAPIPIAPVPKHVLLSVFLV